MPILTPEQLTGRARGHIVDLSPIRCSLQADAAQAFLGLRSAAAARGIDLTAASSFRDFKQQLTIWNEKFRGQRSLLDSDGRLLRVGELNAEQIVRAILHWSALPGASRHHWGSEVDIFDRARLAPGSQPQLLAAEYCRGGVFAHLSAWLAEHAADYGFFMPYDRDRGGVQPEAWHFSYAPLASVALSQLTLPLLAETLQGVELAGAEVVQRLLPEIHERYVRAVAQPSEAALQASAAASVIRPARSS